MPTTPSTINYYIAADGTLRDGSAGSIAQTPRIYYGTEYAVTLSFPASTIAEGDQLQVAVNRSRTFFSSASATGDAPVAAVAKHKVTAAEAEAQAVTLTLSTNTRAMIDQVNGIDHLVRGFFGVHVLRGQSFISLAVADAFMLSVESGPDAISPSLPVVDYPTREEAEALTDRSEAAAERAEQAAAGIVPPLQLDAPPTTSTVGSVGQLATWHDAENNKDHIYHLVFISTSDSATLYHWEECVLVSQGNVAGGYPVLDNNGKILSSQIPNKPIIGTTAPTTSTVGVIGQLYVNTATSKTYHCTAITEDDGVTSYTWVDDINAQGGTITGNLIAGSRGYSHLSNYALFGTASGSITGQRCILVGSNNYDCTYSAGSIGIGLISKTSGGLAIGKYNVSHTNAILVAGNGSDNTNRADVLMLDTAGNLNIAGGYRQNVIKIPSATSDYTFVEGLFSHVPTQAPTYRLPSVSDTTISHYIELTVDFTAVQTYSFLDANGDALIPLFTPAIAVGDVYTFKMEYSAIKAAWLIYPQKQGAVADDFVMRGEVGAANGVAGLDSNAVVPRSQLPNIGNSASSKGVAYTQSGQGVVNYNGMLYLESPTATGIANRTNRGSGKGFGAIAPDTLNTAVTAALTDSNKISLSDAQKAAAQEVFGVGGAIVTIPAATSEYTLSWGRFAHSPSLASVYVLPAVADGSITNDITLSIKFSASVLTYEFQDSAGNTLVPLPLNGDIEDGSVVTFLCRYESLLSQWVIMPVMDGKEEQE